MIKKTGSKHRKSTKLKEKADKKNWPYANTLRRLQEVEENVIKEKELKKRAMQDRRELQEEMIARKQLRTEQLSAARNRGLLEQRLAHLKRQKMDAYLYALRIRHQNEKQEFLRSLAHDSKTAKAVVPAKLKRNHDLDRYKSMRSQNKQHLRNNFTSLRRHDNYKDNNRTIYRDNKNLDRLNRQVERAKLAAKIRETPKENPGPLISRVSTGILSASLPWLKVKQNTLVTENEQQIILHGLNIHGLDENPPDHLLGFMSAAKISEEDIDAVCNNLGANVIRIPLNQEWALYGSNSWSALDYLEEIDGIIARAANHNAYTILTLRRLDTSSVFGTYPGSTGNRIPNYIAPRPNADSIGFWHVLAERYREEPAVIFDLYSSPHAALDDDLTGLSPTWSTWAMWVRMFIAEIRRIRPGSICLVSGLDYATDISGFPLYGSGNDLIPNVMYAIHIDPRLSQISWQTISSLLRKSPVFVTEWCGRAQDTLWGEAIAVRLRSNGIGWTASQLNLDQLLYRKTKMQPYEIQPFSLVVRRAIALKEHRMERSFYIFEKH